MASRGLVDALTDWRTWSSLASGVFALFFLVLVFGGFVPRFADSQIAQYVVRWSLFLSIALFVVGFAWLHYRQESES